MSPPERIPAVASRARPADPAVLARIQAALHQYTISEVLGEGAWGVVYGGSHRQLEREVAIKHLPQNFSDDRTVVRRFAAEARLSAALDHPHIVPVYDYVEQTGLCVFVMQRLHGGTVGEQFASHGYPQPTACATMVAIASAVHSAHRHGVLHRDIKPDNLLLDRDGTVKLADFGVAKVVGGDQTLATLDGTVIGTPAYMAPEQALGQPIGPAADVFAVGAVLYELLSGQLTVGPVSGAMQVMTKRVSVDAIPLADVAPDVPAPVADVVMGSLQRDPSDRYADAESFGIALCDAATRSWGPDWLTSTGLTVRASGPLAIAASGTRNGADDPSAIRHESRVRVAAPTVRRNAHRSIEPPVELAAVDRDELVEVKEVLRVPRFPWVPTLLTLLTAVALIAFGVTSTAGPDHTAGVPDGTVLIDGQDVVADGPLDVDFSSPLTVDVNEPRAERGSVELRFDVLDVPLGSTSADVIEGAAELPAPTLQYATGGPLDAELVVSDEQGRDLLTTDVAVIGRQTGYATVAGVGAILLMLFALAHVESALRPLRRGVRRTSALLSLLLTGAVLGVAVAAAGWALAAGPISIARLVTAGAIGAAFGPLLGWTTYLIGRRRRIRLASNREGGR